MEESRKEKDVGRGKSCLETDVQRRKEGILEGQESGVWLDVGVGLSWRVIVKKHASIRENALLVKN